MSLCGVIVYYNWKAYREDGERLYDPVKPPFRKGEFESNREPEETFDWFSIMRDRDTLGLPWRTEHLGATDEEARRMTPEFEEFLYVCRRLPALYFTMRQAAEREGTSVFRIAKKFSKIQRDYIRRKFEASRKLLDDTNSEIYKNVDGTWIHDMIPLGGSVKWPLFSDRVKELRKRKIKLDNEIIQYVESVLVQGQTMA